MTGAGARLGCLLLGVASVAMVVSSCSLPTDAEATPIDRDLIDPQLANTTTTTTSTTIASVVEPQPTVASVTTVAVTTLPIETTRERIFYTLAGTDTLNPALVLLTEPVLESIQIELEQPRAEVRSINLRSSVRRGLIETMSFSRAVLTVSLDSSVFQAMSDQEIRNAIGQIVLTYTSFRTDEGSIGSVIIALDGEPIPVFVPLSNTDVPAGTPLYFDDFRPLLGSIDASVPTTATPTTAAPVTSPPPPVSEPSASAP